MEHSIEEHYANTISAELSIRPQQVKAVAELLADGATVPFIARYRKEKTDSLDEVAIQSIRDRLFILQELDKRRDFILQSLEERDLLTDELKNSIQNAPNMTELEDIYLPYRPKRRTRATKAKEKGLEPLAEQIISTPLDKVDINAFIDPEKGVTYIEEAIAGAQDIIAEWISENPRIRQVTRRYFEREAILSSKVVADKEEEGQKFRDYFDWNEPLDKAPSHRVLAILRGQNEGFLGVHALPESDGAIQRIAEVFFRHNQDNTVTREALNDAYKRLLRPSIETETIHDAKERADLEAIRVFADNLRELLLAPPLGRKTIIAIDPGFRTGCKTVVLDRQGKLLTNLAIYPTQGPRKAEEAALILRQLHKQYNVEAIAIGNGTAGRETEQFVRELDLGIPVIQVNESGASIYSASEVARREFPDHDVTVRGAVSIGRRLQDALAELVKLDPKSIGVGQYQHDVDQRKLKQELDDVVISCVNAVGVELNTASAQLLAYVSGLGPQLATNIVHHRDENGPFHSRKELLKVPRLGAKAYEQAAGFLRISDGKNPLDASAVHPERYDLVKTIASDLGLDIRDLMTDASCHSRVDLKRYVSDDVGLPTLKDIMQELAKPGRDPRGEFEMFSFSEDVHSIEDLQPGMKLPGIVTNVTQFGAFVDVGVHQDGLVHISQLANRYVKDPAEIVKVQQKVHVTVLDVDTPRKRISLSMK